MRSCSGPMPAIGLIAPPSTWYRPRKERVLATTLDRTADLGTDLLKIYRLMVLTRTFDERITRRPDFGNLKATRFELAAELRLLMQSEHPTVRASRLAAPS